MLELFQMATAEHGVPSRVRTDKEGENVLVWQVMESLRGQNRNSYLTSTSTRNKRIERLWRDVWMYVCRIFTTHSKEWKLKVFFGFPSFRILRERT